MPGITFDAFDGDAPIGIGRVFALLPTRAWSLSWRATRGFEAVPTPSTGTLVALLHTLADDEAELSSDIIAQLTGADLQVIDGELRACDDQADRLDFIVRSVRGDEWDIEARSSDELDQIAAQLAAWHPVPHPLL